MNSQQDQYRDDDDDEDDDDLKASSNSEISESDINESDLDDSQDDDDDDDYEENSKGKRKKKLSGSKKNKHDLIQKKLKKNRFVEEEAEEASEEDDDLDEDHKKRPELKDKEYDRQFNLMMQRRQQSHDVIQKIEERFKDLPEGEAQGLYDIDGLESNEIEQEPPSSNDPKIWRVSCTRGKETDSTLSLMFKYSGMLSQDVNNRLSIVSVFSLKKFPGAIFIEAYFEWQVLRAIEGMYNLRHTGIEMLQEQQCISLFTPIEQEAIPIEQGQWVRVRNHAIYNDDLGRVLEVNDTRRTLLLKLVPREKRELVSFVQDQKSKRQKQELALNDQYKGELEEEDLQQKPSKWALRMKNLIEQKRYVRGPKIPIKQDKIFGTLRDDQSHFYYTDLIQERQRCKQDGFILLHLNSTNVLWKNIKPNLEELSYFFPDVKDMGAFLPKLKKSLKQAVGTKQIFKIGDKVNMVNDNTGVKFSVKDVQQDGRLLVQHATKDKGTGEIKLYEQLVDTDQVTIAFSKYQQINVTSGPYKGIQGIILELQNNTATISTDSNKVIQCQLSDLQAQQRVKGNDLNQNCDPLQTAISGQQPEQTNNTSKDKSSVTRYDLIRFGGVDTDIGCVLSIQNSEINVLDLTNKVRCIKSMIVTQKLPTRNNVAKNMHRHEIRQGDLVVVLDGFYKDCRATVIHVYRDYLFLHSGKFDNTQGIIVEKVNVCALISSASSGQQQRGTNNPRAATDKNNNNNNNNNNSNINNNTMSGVDEFKSLIGQNITISRGQWGGYRGQVIQVQPKTITIQLIAKNLTVKVLRQDVIQGETQQNTQSSFQAGKTPHYAPQNTQKGWGEENDHQKQAYMSPYMINTPMHEY